VNEREPADEALSTARIRALDRERNAQRVVPSHRRSLYPGTAAAPESVLFYTRGEEEKLNQLIRGTGLRFKLVSRRRVDEARAR